MIGSKQDLRQPYYQWWDLRPRSPGITHDTDITFNPIFPRRRYTPSVFSSKDSANSERIRPWRLVYRVFHQMTSSQACHIHLRDAAVTFWVWEYRAHPVSDESNWVVYNCNASPVKSYLESLNWLANIRRQSSQHVPIAKNWNLDKPSRKQIDWNKANELIGKHYGLYYWSEDM